jgi:hypothetical protein
MPAGAWLVMLGLNGCSSAAEMKMARKVVAAETVARFKEALEALGVQVLKAGQVASGPGVVIKGGIV